MVSTFNDKFRQDLEIIYAKYSSPFDGAPELTLSTCELPENVQLIEGYKYSNCGKWKVLGHDPDNVCENESTSEDDRDDKANTCCSDSDTNESLSSDCSQSFKREKSFREKYPRSCAKKDQSLQISPSVNSLKKSKKSPNSVHKNLFTSHDEEEESSNMPLARNACYSSDEIGKLKPKATVTISQDLWTQVQQCLRLMTSVFSELNDCDKGKTKHPEKLCNDKDSQKLCEQNLRRSCIKEKLFDDHTPKSQHCVPTRGHVMEKLFIRQKGSNRVGIQLASRETFLHPRSKISETESLDSSFCQEYSSKLDTSTRKYNSTLLSSPARITLGQEILINKESSTSLNSCANAFAFKPLSLAARNKISPVGVPHVASPDTLTKPASHTSSGKKRRPRYRLVRRRCLRPHSTSETQTSEAETEPGARAQEKIERKQDSSQQFLGGSDSGQLYVPAKTKGTSSDNRKETARPSSPDMDDVIFMEVPAPLAPQDANAVKSPSSVQTTALPETMKLFQTGIIREHCRSSTPRKRIYPRMNSTATVDPGAPLRRTEKHSSMHADPMPSPIRPSVSSNTSQTETLLTINDSFTSNEDHSSQFISKAHDAANGSLPTARAILQPQIPLHLLTTKDILKKRCSDVQSHNTQNDGCDHNLKSSPLDLKRIPSSSSCPHPALHLPVPTNDLSKQTRNVAEPVCRRQPFSEDEEKHNSWRDVRATDRSIFSSPKPVLRKPERNLTIQSPTTPSGRDSNITKSEKQNGRSEKYTYQSKNRQLLHEKCTSPSKNSQHIEKYTSPCEKRRSSLQQQITPRRAKFHPYAGSGKFPKSPLMTSSIRDLTLKSPSSSRDTQRWTTLDRSPIAISVLKARRMSDPVLASRKVLQFGPEHTCGAVGKEKTSRTSSDHSRVLPQNNQKRSERSVFSPWDLKLSTKKDERNEEEDVDCSRGKCRKMFCFNCSMDMSN